MDIIKNYEARREAARRQMNADLKAASALAPSEPAGPSPDVGSDGVVGLLGATATKSCDSCDSQEGRHYCLLHSIQIKNMDTVRCKDWSEKQPNT